MMKAFSRWLFMRTHRREITMLRVQSMNWCFGEANLFYCGVGIRCALRILKLSV